MALLSRVWPDFCALHMAWGAINELTALDGVPAARQARRPPRPVGAPRAHHARRVAALLLLLPPGRGAAPAAGRGAGQPRDRGPVLGSGRERGAGPGRSSASWPATSSAATRDAPPPARSTRPSGGCRASRPCGWSRPGSIRSPSTRPALTPATVAHRGSKEDGMATATTEPYRTYSPRPFTRAAARLHDGPLRRPPLAPRAAPPGGAGEQRLQGAHPAGGHQGGSPHRARGGRHRAVLPDELHDREPRQLPQEGVEDASAPTR